MKRIFIVIICTMLTLLGTSASAKTLVVYYSYTNYCREITTTLTSQIEADVLEIQPAEKGLNVECQQWHQEGLCRPEGRLSQPELERGKALE